MGDIGIEILGRVTESILGIKGFYMKLVTDAIDVGTELHNTNAMFYVAPYC